MIELNFKEYISNTNITAQNQRNPVNPVARGALRAGFGIMGAGGTSLQNSLGSTFNNNSGFSGASQAADQLISAFNVDNNYLQFTVNQPMPDDKNPETAKVKAIEEAKKFLIDGDYARKYGLNPEHPEIVRVDVDEKNQIIKFRLRYPVYMRTSDRVNMSWNYRPSQNP